ncbi:carnitine transporter [Friedmanniomyces endolithicus]|nr:carnitine transporter [Friedmanniomyces endolithicus]
MTPAIKPNGSVHVPSSKDLATSVDLLPHPTQTRWRSPAMSSSSSSSSTSPSITDKLPSAKELEQDVAVAAKKSVSSLRDFAAGGVGGIFAVVVGHPFDLVKVRLQTAEKGVYTGAMDVVRKTVAREGLMRGYGVGKQLVESFSTVKDGQFSVGQISAAGFFSAIPMTIITAPFERVKIILQIQGQKQLAPGEKPRYSGGVDVV